MKTMNNRVTFFPPLKVFQSSHDPEGIYLTPSPRPFNRRGLTHFIWGSSVNNVHLSLIPFLLFPITTTDHLLISLLWFRLYSFSPIISPILPNTILKTCEFQGLTHNKNIVYDKDNGFQIHISANHKTQK